MKFLVTGATGFIGSHLVGELSKKYPKSEIFCTVRPSSEREILSQFNVKFILADITDFNAISNIKHKFDFIFHCAGYVGSDRNNLHYINVIGTENICRLALKLKVSRLIYTSSVAVISGNSKIPLTEDLPYKATNEYGESKIKAEKAASSFRKKGLKIAILRPCMVYGEGEPHLMSKLVFLLKYRLLPFVGKCRNKLHLVYVKNVIDALIYSMENDDMLKDTYFIADNEMLSVKEIMKIMASAINEKPPYKLPVFFTSILDHIPGIKKKLFSFRKDRVYSIEKIKSTGFIPGYPARTSLFKSFASFNPDYS